MIYIVVEKNKVFFFDNFYNRKVPDKKSLDYKIALSLYDSVKSPYIVQTTIPDKPPSVAFKKCWNDLSEFVFKHWFIIEPTTQSQQQEKTDAWWQVSNDLKLEDSKFYVCESGLENTGQNIRYFDSYLFYEYNLISSSRVKTERKNNNDISYKIISFNLKPKKHRNILVSHLKEKSNKDHVFYTHPYLGKNTSKYFDKYKEGAIALVGETNFYTPYSNYSEKTIDCFLTQTPFLLAAPANTLNLIKLHGFKTFSDYWSEEYDKIQNHEMRLNEIKIQLDRILSLNMKQIKEILLDMQDILLYNYKHAHQVASSFNKDLERLLQ